MMGSYAAQLDIHQRWLVIAYIKKQQAGKGGDAFTMGLSAPAGTTTSDTTAKTDETSATQTAQGGSTGANQGGHH
jgi:hypothetical protein